MQTFFVLTLLTFGILAIVRPRDNRWVHCLIVSVTAFAVSGFFLALVLPKLGTRLYAPVTYDQWFFLADTWLGSPSWWLGRLLATHPLIAWLARASYSQSMNVGVIAVSAVMISQGVTRGWKCYATMTSQAFLAWPFYLTLPACGPVYAFPGFPWHLPKIAAPHVLRLAAFPNCIPSVHMSTALMAAFFVSSWRVGRWLGAVYVALTVLATLGLGEHYLIDLIAALPYTYFLLRAWGWIPRRNSSAPLVQSKAREQEQIHIQV